jgi:hypothetical protein
VPHLRRALAPAVRVRLATYVRRIAFDLRDPLKVSAELGEANELLGKQEETPAAVIRLVLDLTEALRNAGEEQLGPADPYRLIALLNATLAARHAVGDDDPARRRELRLRLEQLRQLFLDLAGDEPVSDERSGKEIARWLAEVVDVSQQQLADLLGVKRRTFQRWVSEKDEAGPNTVNDRRLRIVARLVNQLRHGLSPTGVIRWFEHPRAALGDRRPADVLDEPDVLARLQTLAASVRLSDAS